MSNARLRRASSRRRRRTRRRCAVSIRRSGSMRYACRKAQLRAGRSRRLRDERRDECIPTRVHAAELRREIVVDARHERDPRDGAEHRGERRQGRPADPGRGTADRLQDVNGGRHWRWDGQTHWYRPARIFTSPANGRGRFGAGPRERNHRPKDDVFERQAGAQARRADRRCRAKLPQHDGARTDEQQGCRPAADGPDVVQPLTAIESENVRTRSSFRSCFAGRLRFRP